MTTLEILRQMRDAVHDLEVIEHHMPEPHWTVMNKRRLKLAALIGDMEATLTRQQQTVVVVEASTLEEVGE